MPPRSAEAGDSLMPGYMYIMPLDFSVLVRVFAVDGRVVDAVHGRPGTAAIARAAAGRLYSQAFRDRRISPGFARPRLDSVKIDPASAVV
eukprot:7445593-Pyramimonas_sp.AAC.1